MRAISRTVLFILLAIAAATASAQYDCGDYHKFNCDRSSDTRFKLNGQSKSASVQIGVPTKLNIIVYAAQDYRISFCYDEKVIGDHVVARLIEKVRQPKEVSELVMEKTELKDASGNPTGQFKEVSKTVKKTVFSDVDKVLWDNQEHDMADEVEFTATATKRLMVEVTAPGAVDPKPKANDKEFDIGCVGILIEHMPTPAMGFGAP